MRASLGVHDLGLCGGLHEGLGLYEGQHLGLGLFRG